MSAPLPQPFAPYEISQAFGKGDMGTDYVAQDTRSGQTVALKVLDQFDLSAKMDREAIVEIVRFAATLQHPYLHPILDVLATEAEGGLVAIITPMAPARSLGDYLKAGKKIPAKHALNIINRLAQALDFLHRQDVAHGGVKPTNVLLDKEANASLTDLPMAHLREYGLIPPQASELLQYYLPPEVTINAAPETRGDIFSLGVLAYHLLAGHIPFDDPDPEARHALPKQGNLPPLLYYVLLRAMTHRLELRYTTIGAFMQDLQAVQQGQIDPDTVRWFKVSDETPPDDLP